MDNLKKAFLGLFRPAEKKKVSLSAVDDLLSKVNNTMRYDQKPYNHKKSNIVEAMGINDERFGVSVAFVAKSFMTTDALTEVFEAIEKSNEYTDREKLFMAFHVGRMVAGKKA